MTKERLVMVFLGLLALSGLIAAGVSYADRTKNSTRRILPFDQPAGVGNLRPTATSYSAPWANFHASIYDTLGSLVYVGSGLTYANTMPGYRVFLRNVTLFGDDSAAGTPTVFIRFFNASTKQTYLKLTKAYTAGEISNTQWSNIDYAFPYDTTVVMQVFTHTANTSMDSLNVNASWELDVK